MALFENEPCSTDFSYTNFVISIIILFGLMISYLPQHYRIISRGTSEGISPYFVLLGTTSATAGFANILTLPQSKHDVMCCKELGGLECAAGLLGIAQLGAQWICFAFIFVLFLVFFRYTDADIPEEELAEVEDAPRWQTAVIVASVVLIHGLLVIIITAVFALVLPASMYKWATFLGLSGAVLAAVQYMPQIWTTYHLKHVGSLSIPMMCIQTPGGFLFAGSLFARLGWGGWSSWGIFLLTATMQGILLSMALYYAFMGHGHGEGSNRPPLPRSYSRVYANGLDESMPTQYSGHPEHYADNPDELGDILDRQESDAAAETQPLLKPGGIGNPHRRDV